MAASIAVFSGGLKVKVGVLAVQISSLPLRRELPRYFSSSAKTVAAISSSLRVSAVHNQQQQQRHRSSWPRVTTFCTAAPDAGTTVTAVESEKKSESQEEEDNVKETANLLEIKVGRVVKAWQHEEADSLYVEEVDIGEAEPRIICSGLVKYVPLDLLQVSFIFQKKFFKKCEFLILQIQIVRIGIGLCENRTKLSLFD